MKRIALLLFIATTSATPARADPDASTNEAFWLTIRRQGIDVDRDHAFAYAAAVCDVIAGAGQTRLSVAQGLAEDNPSWSLDDAAYFVGAATTAFCPQYAPPS